MVLRGEVSLDDPVSKFLPATVKVPARGESYEALLTERVLTPLSMQPRRRAGSPTMRIGLGWNVLQVHGRVIKWHNGGTGGFRIWMGVDSATNVAAIVLTNGGNSSDEIGLRLLDAESPLRTVTVRPVVTVPADVLEQNVGRYVMSPAMTIEITRDGETLFATPTAQPRLRLWASSARKFYLRVAPVTMAFEPDSTGMWMRFEQGAAKMRVRKQ